MAEVVAPCTATVETVPLLLYLMHAAIVQRWTGTYRPSPEDEESEPDEEDPDEDELPEPDDVFEPAPALPSLSSSFLAIKRQAQRPPTPLRADDWPARTGCLDRDQVTIASFCIPRTGQ